MDTTVRCVATHIGDLANSGPTYHLETERIPGVAH